MSTKRELEAEVKRLLEREAELLRMLATAQETIGRLTVAPPFHLQVPPLSDFEKNTFISTDGCHYANPPPGTLVS